VGEEPEGGSHVRAHDREDSRNSNHEADKREAEWKSDKEKNQMKNSKGRPNVGPKSAPYPRGKGCLSDHERKQQRLLEERKKGELIK